MAGEVLMLNISMDGGLIVGLIDGSVGIREPESPLSLLLLFDLREDVRWMFF